MANPLGIGRELADGSIVGFTPDGRFSTVVFHCGEAVSLPFIGWAVVAFQEGDGYSTRLLAVGLGEDGRPVTELDLRRRGGDEIQTRLVGAASIDISRSASRVEEIISNVDPVFEGESGPVSLADAEIFSLPGDDADDPDIDT